MSEHTKYGLEGIKQHTGREKTALKTSGPWFLASGLVFLVTLLAAAISAPVVICGALLVVGLVLLALAGHKHGKAGGHDSGWHYTG